MAQSAEIPLLRGRFLGALLVSAALSGCVTTQARRSPPQPVPPLAKAVVKTAKSYLAEEENHKQVPRDCSDFVQTVFAQHGIRLPRTSKKMCLIGSKIRSSRELRMGDLVFFSGSRRSHIVGHVGIYVNKGLFIHLTHPEDGVTMDSMYNDYYRKRYITARRVIQ